MVHSSPIGLNEPGGQACCVEAKSVRERRRGRNKAKQHTNIVWEVVEEGVK